MPEYSELIAPQSDKKTSWKFASIATIVCLINQLINPGLGYDLYLQIYAILGLWPVFSLVFMFWKSKQIALGIFLLTVFQTWNMFLHPYLADAQYFATYRTVNPLHYPEMGFFCLLSIFSLYFGFIWGYYKLGHSSFWGISVMSYEAVHKSLIWILIVGISSSLLQSVLGYFGLTISFLSSIDIMIPTVVGSLLMMYLLRNGKNLVLILLTLTYLIYNFIYVVGGTLFIYVILMMMGPLVVFVTERKKIPYFWIIVGCILLLPIYAHRHEYRSMGLHSSGAVKFDLGRKILKETYSNFSFEDLSKGDTHTSDPYKDDRMEGVTYLAQIVHCHEDLDYPYQFGNTFKWLPTMFMPRMFMPMRPGQNMGTEWAEYYHVKDPSWRCSINFPMLVEFYCNFGWLGMVLMSFINGLAIVWVMGKFNFGYGDANLLLLLFVAIKIIVVEANITLNYGLILQVLFVCWLIKKYQIKHSSSNE